MQAGSNETRFKFQQIDRHHMKRIKTEVNGPEFSQFIAGYWRLMEWNMTPQQRLTFLKQHVELGITTCDHADIYGNYECEAAFGEALKLDPSMRDSIEIVSKCGIRLPSAPSGDIALPHYNTTTDYIVSQAEQSLKNLHTDHLDLLLIHRPDPLMNVDDIAEAFTRLKQDGKVKHVGVSNFTTSQFDLLQSRLDYPLATNQLEISPVNMTALHDGSLDQMQQHRIAPMAWSCLGGGSLFNGQDEKSKRLRAELEIIAAEVGAEGIDQIVYAWVLALPSKPLPIIGSGKIERVRQAIRSADITLTRQQWFRIWVASNGHNVP